MYKDIAFGLNKNEFNDVRLIEDVRSIKQSIYNILMTNKGELHYFPQFGCNIRKYLFEKVNPLTILAIKDEVDFAIRNFEPRVTVVRTDVYEDEYNANSIIIDLIYYIDTIREEVSQQLTLRLL